MLVFLDWIVVGRCGVRTANTVGTGRLLGQESFPLFEEHQDSSLVIATWGLRICPRGSTQSKSQIPVHLSRCTMLVCICLLLSLRQLPEHLRRAAMEVSSDDDSDEDAEGGGKFEAGWGKNRYICTVLYTARCTLTVVIR